MLGRFDGDPLAGEKAAAIFDSLKASVDCRRSGILGGIGSRPFLVPVLLLLWQDFVPWDIGVFHGAFVVEKNMLWYNCPMGKKRRSKEFKNNSQVIDMEEARRQRLEKRRAEREKEELKAKESARQKTRGKMAIRRSRNRRRALIGIVVVLIGVAIAFTVIHIASLKKEQSDVKAQKEELEKEKQQLMKELEDIGDLQNLEEQARDQLRLIKKGETIYIFPEEITNADEDDTDADN